MKELSLVLFLSLFSLSPHRNLTNMHFPPPFSHYVLFSAPLSSEGGEKGTKKKSIFLGVGCSCSIFVILGNIHEQTIKKSGFTRKTVSEPKIIKKKKIFSLYEIQPVTPKKKSMKDHSPLRPLSLLFFLEK